VRKKAGKGVCDQTRIWENLLGFFCIPYMLVCLWLYLGETSVV
jgi:hypothetical protein